jgi:cytochrome c553
MLEMKMARSLKLILAALFGFALFASSGNPGWAQNEARVKQGLENWKAAGCPDCHGSFADGDKQRDESPSGPNLRQRGNLNAETIKTVVGCGRPGSEMPSFEDGAYTKRQCYGRPLGDAPGNMYPAPAKLTADQIDAIATYLLARIIGKGAITKAECLAYYDESQKSWCDDIN